MSQYGDPILTDFGIASHFHHTANTEASLSIPWSPPEAIFDTAAIDQRCDIYSLAATPNRPQCHTGTRM